MEWGMGKGERKSLLSAIVSVRSLQSTIDSDRHQNTRIEPIPSAVNSRINACLWG